jgi:hypothetical protein
MNINITDLKECEKHLGKAVLDNRDLTGTDFYHHLCLGISEIQWIVSRIEKGIEPKNIHVIFSTIGNNQLSQGANELKEIGINIHSYKDERINKRYIPSIKPFLLYKWLEQYPQYGKCFFLHDADIIFRELPDFDNMLDDDICYLSDTIGYIGYNYIMDCCRRYESQHPSSEKGQLIKEMADTVGIDVRVIKENQENSGGGQYIIKNTDYKLWEKIYLAFFLKTILQFQVIIFIVFSVFCIFSYLVYTFICKCSSILQV